MTPANARRLEALKWANSYTRLAALLALQRYPGFWEHIGREWSRCDNIASYHQRVMRVLLDRRAGEGFPIFEAMDAGARQVYDDLPARVTVWRGCYSHNVRGVSWTLDRATAASFPFLNRYCQDGAIDRALLIEGRIAKADIAFVVLDRGEQEVVLLPYKVEFAGQSLAFDALDDARRDRMFPRGRAGA